MIIRKLSTTCEAFLTERITLESHTLVAPFRLALFQEQLQKATLQIVTHNHKHLQQ